MSQSQVIKRGLTVSLRCLLWRRDHLWGHHSHFQIIWWPGIPVRDEAAHSSFLSQEQHQWLAATGRLIWAGYRNNENKTNCKVQCYGWTWMKVSLNSLRWMAVTYSWAIKRLFLGPFSQSVLGQELRQFSGPGPWLCLCILRLGASLWRGHSGNISNGQGVVSSGGRIVCITTISVSGNGLEIRVMSSSTSHKTQVWELRDNGWYRKKAEETPSVSRRQHSYR